MNDLATIDQPTTQNAVALMMDPAKLKNLMDFADMMAKSAITVPQHLRGKPADCFAIAMQAMQWGMNPFAVAQKTHLVNGTLGYEAQLVNAVIQASGAIQGAFHYEYSDKQGLSCRVGAMLRGEHNLTWGPWLDENKVQTKNSPLWKTNPRQQLGYLQVKNWARLYAPGAILGVYTPDELETAPSMGPAGPASEVMGDGSSRPLMPTRTTPAQKTSGDVIDAGGAPFDTAKPPPPPAPAPQTQGGTQTSLMDEADDGELATDGHKRNLEIKAKAAGVDLQAVLTELGFKSETLTLTQFDRVKKELSK